MTSLTALRNAAKHTEGESPTMLEIEKEERVEELKQAFIEDEISEQDFDTLLDAAFENDAPFRADWFMQQPESRRKRYSEKDIYVYYGEEYIVEGDLVLPAGEDDLGTRESRVVSVTGNVPDEDEIEEIERDEELSPEAEEKQEEIKESLGLDG